MTLQFIYFLCSCSMYWLLRLFLPAEQYTFREVDGPDGHSIVPQRPECLKDKLKNA